MALQSHQYWHAAFLDNGQYQSQIPPLTTTIKQINHLIGLVDQVG
jgi:hypothetical protein